MELENMEQAIKTETPEQKPGLFKRLITKIKHNMKVKAEEKAYIAEIKRDARRQAMQEIKPELVKQIKQQEIDKITGKAKSDKLKKLAAAFSSPSGSKGSSSSTDKINMMLGIGNNQQQSGRGVDVLKYLGRGATTTSKIKTKPKKKKQTYYKKVYR